MGPRAVSGLGLISKSLQEVLGACTISALKACLMGLLAAKNTVGISLSKRQIHVIRYG